MGKLMKYEFRKTMFSKMVILLVTALAEVVFLAGVFLKWDKGLGIGTVGLYLCAIIGIFYIGIESISIFHKDLNTKQSYMLFLTPRSSYQILGAKIVENFISLFAAGIFFAALAALDGTVAILYIGGLEELLAVLKEMAISLQFEITFAWQDIVVICFTALTFWLMVIVTGYLAIVLCATVFAGRKFSGVVSFILFILINWIISQPVELIPEVENQNLQYGLVIGVVLLMVAVMYAVTGWIMERKLSV